MNEYISGSAQVLRFGDRLRGARMRRFGHEQRVERRQTCSGRAEGARIINEYIRGTVQIRQFGNQVRESRLRWFAHVKRTDAGYSGKSLLNIIIELNIYHKVG